MAGEQTAHIALDLGTEQVHPKFSHQSIPCHQHMQAKQTKVGNNIPVSGQKDRPKTFMDFKPQGKALI